METLVIELTAVELSYQGNLILDIPHLSIYQWEKIGIVGSNGVGKSTLLKLIAGKLDPDKGIVKRHIDSRYFSQLGRGERKSDSNGKINSLLKVTHERIGQLSGGQETRLKLAEVFGTYSEGLLLDEPTTHLDDEGKNFLIKELENYYGTLLIVSHDRGFLDQTVSKIIEIKDHQVKVYQGNYCDYQKQVAEEELANEREILKITKERNRLSQLQKDLQKQAQGAEKVSHSQKQRQIKPNRLAGTKEKGSIAKGLHKRSKGVNKRLELLGETPRRTVQVPITFQPNHQLTLHNNFPIRGESLSLVRNQKVLLSKSDFQFDLGKVHVIQGPNGCGKSSLLKQIVAGQAGVYLSPKVVFGYFEQDSFRQPPADSLLSYLLKETSSSETLIRSVLHHLGFEHASLRTAVSNLSGGEYLKVLLAKTFLSESNVLILDEPTSFLDVGTMEALQRLIKAYQGTVILVAHDEYFVAAVGEVFWEFIDEKLVRI